MDRRSLLQLFGAGAVIAPVLNNTPVRAAEARIIEPPKVELVSEMPKAAPTPPHPMAVLGHQRVTLLIEDSANVITLRGDAVITSYNITTDIYAGASFELRGNFLCAVGLTCQGILDN